MAAGGRGSITGVVTLSLSVFPVPPIHCGDRGYGEDGVEVAVNEFPPR